MKRYMVTSPVVFHSGLIRLSEDQARKRSHQVEREKGDTYKIISPISFKAGEEVGFNDVAKVYAHNLKEIVERKTKAKK